MRQGRLSLGDVRSVFRLLGDARELRNDAAAQAERIVDGAIRLLGAETGHIYHIEQWRPGVIPRVLAVAAPAWSEDSFLRTLGFWANEFPLTEDPFCHWALSRAPGRMIAGLHRVMPAEQRPRFTPFMDLLATFNTTDIAVGLFQQGDAVVGLSLQRHRGSPPFDRRQMAMVRLLVREWELLHRAGHLSPPRPPALEAGLPPRRREVLRGLLRGEQPKAMAYRLGISVHTVREHVAAIYRHFGVSTREALMALALRQVRGGDTPPDAPPDAR